jgi:hypothetical protein
MIDKKAEYQALCREAFSNPYNANAEPKSTATRTCTSGKCGFGSNECFKPASRSPAIERLEADPPTCDIATAECKTLAMQASAANDGQYDGPVAEFCAGNPDDPFCSAFKEPCFTKAHQAGYKTLDMLNNACAIDCSEVLKLNYSKMDLNNPEIMTCISENVNKLIGEARTLSTKALQAEQLNIVKSMLNTQIQSMEDGLRKIEIEVLARSVQSALDGANAPAIVTAEGVIEESLNKPYSTKTIIIIIMIVSVVIIGAIVGVILMIRKGVIGGFTGVNVGSDAVDIADAVDPGSSYVPSYVNLR